MQELPFTLTEDQESQPAVGLVVLQSDETMEHELRHWLPDHYRLFHTRIPNHQEVNHNSLLDMQKRLPGSVSLLPSNTHYKVIAYGCTSATTVIGEEVVREAINSVFPKSLVTNPITAIKAKLAHLNAKRIALLTPYTPEVSQSMVNLLANSGYEISHSGTFNESLDENVARISSQSILDAIQQLAKHNDIDALVASCTSLRAFDIIEDASQNIGCPVMSSNSALAWHIEALVG